MTAADGPLELSIVIPCFNEAENVAAIVAAVNAEPSTMSRENWRQTDRFPVKQVRDLYRHLKFNFDYLT